MLFVMVPADRLAAQQFTVQQPTVSTFSAGTTISVPDRGRAVVGGVGRGASSRATYGPFPMNTNYGSSFEGSSASAHAWIHDFSELDRQALDAAHDKSRGNSAISDRRAASAYRSLTERTTDTRPTSSEPGSHDRRRALAADTKRGSESDERGSLSTDELYQRGMKAKAAGKRGVALAFLRLARDRGSEAAARELATIELGRKSKSIREDSEWGTDRSASEDAHRAPGGLR